MLETGRSARFRSGASHVAMNAGKAGGHGAVPVLLGDYWRRR